MAATQDGRDVAVTVSAVGDVTLAFSTLVALGAQNMQISVPLATVNAGDTLSVRALAAIPAGYDLGAAYCSTTGTLVVVVATPALIIGGSFSIPVRVLRTMVSS